MIISHKHKFIFIKTQKTAGTSIEIALSKICGDDDVITPISPADEVIRAKLGYRGPQHHTVKGVRVFYNHIPASTVRHLVGEDVWKNYFTFCFERNPWDKVISWYYHLNKTEPRPTISDFIRSGGAASVGGPGGFNIYTTSGDIAVNRVFLYENLDLELQRIQDQLGLPQLPPLPRAKSTTRKDKRHYREILTEEDRIAIEATFKREIALFGYRF